MLLVIRQKFWSVWKEENEEWLNTWLEQDG